MPALDRLKLYPEVVEKLFDIYDTLARGYAIHPESIISKDGLDAVESIGQLLREVGRISPREHPDPNRWLPGDAP